MIRSLIFSTLALLLLNPNASMACCGGIKADEFAQAARSATAIFIGKVVKKDNLQVVKQGDAFLQPELIHFKVIKAWRGVDQTEIAVETRFRARNTASISTKLKNGEAIGSAQGSSADGLLGYPFRYGETYLVVTEQNGMHVDSQCSLTRPLDTPLSIEDAAIIKSLGPSQKILGLP